MEPYRREERASRRARSTRARGYRARGYAPFRCSLGFLASLDLRAPSRPAFRLALATGDAQQPVRPRRDATRRDCLGACDHRLRAPPRPLSLREAKWNSLADPSKRNGPFVYAYPECCSELHIVYSGASLATGVQEDAATAEGLANRTFRRRERPGPAQCR